MICEALMKPSSQSYHSLTQRECPKDDVVDDIMGMFAPAENAILHCAMVIFKRNYACQGVEAIC